VTPYLDEKSRKWAHLPNEKTVFYVGNVGYHPNRLGVDYIIREIAPRVLAQIPDAIFKIVGASPDQVDSHLHRPVDPPVGDLLTRRGSRAVRDRESLRCPDKNTFGVKFKVAEAMSYGTPTIVSHETKLGFPQHRRLPSFALDNPLKGAETVASFLRNPESLVSLSHDLLAEHRAFAWTQRTIWSSTLSAVQTLVLRAQGD
jgi:hypothetical protein